MGRLLVIDDSPTIRKVVELTFRGTDWTVDFAASVSQRWRSSAVPWEHILALMSAASGYRDRFARSVDADERLSTRFHR